MKRWLLLLPVAAGAFAPATARADSLWDRRDPRYAYLFQDNQARQVGDVLTVLVSESTVSSDQDQRALNKTTNASGQVQLFKAGVATSGGTGSTAAPITGVTLPSASENTTRQFTGSATLSTNRVFTDRMAVTVVDVMPNGNLVVEGYRSRVVAGEERMLRVTGIVRQQDIGLGNIVQSTSMANFRISYLGRGPASRTVNQGYLGRLLNLISPF